jgi:hypothetical protein
MPSACRKRGSQKKITNKNPEWNRQPGPRTTRSMRGEFGPSGGKVSEADQGKIGPDRSCDLPAGPAAAVDIHN